jgi:hypothetical protein
MVGRVWPRHGHRGRPLNSIVRHRMDAPSKFQQPERYVGRPLFVIVENYILDAIGELDEEALRGMVAIVQRVWGGGDDWRATVRRELDWNDSIDQSYQDMWQKNREIATRNGIDLHPIEFAKMVTDKNFGHLQKLPARDV